jgi:hypothetical protein
VQPLRRGAKDGCPDHSPSPVFVLHTPELYGRVVTHPPALNCEVLGSTPDHGRYKDRNLGGSARQAWVQAFCPVQDRQPFCCGEFLHCPFSMELALSAASLPHNSVMKLPDQNTPSLRTSRQNQTPPPLHQSLACNHYTSCQLIRCRGKIVRQRVLKIYLSPESLELLSMIKSLRDLTLTLAHAKLYLDIFRLQLPIRNGMIEALLPSGSPIM